MKVVYIVTSGCYSDYSIRACFSTREAAQALIDEWRERNDYRVSDANIEEWDLDDEVRPSADHRRIHVDLAENGDTNSVTDKHPSGDPLDTISWWSWTRPSTSPAYKGARKDIYFSGTVWARDFDHAIKMARDARAASIAAGDLDRLRAKPGPAWEYQRATHPNCTPADQEKP